MKKFSFEIIDGKSDKTLKKLGFISWGIVVLAYLFPLLVVI